MKRSLAAMGLMLLWWWGPEQVEWLQLVVAPVGHGCAAYPDCTPAEVANTWALRQPQIIRNTWYGFPPDAADPAEPDGYRRQLGVPDPLPVGMVMWWGELP